MIPLIKFEHLVLVPLLTLYEKENKTVIDSESLFRYKIKLANILSYDLIRVDFEVGEYSRNNFKTNYKDYVSVYNDNENVYYSLNKDINLDDIWNKIYYEIPSNIIEYMTNSLAINVFETDRIKTLNKK